jgi:transcriptional regulator with XRE-family HTH domain
MLFSSLHIDKRRRTYVRLIGEIRHALNQALSEENQSRGLTRAAIARLLGKNKSFVSRKLNGTSNMTLETLADLAFALDRPVKISLPLRSTAPQSNIAAVGTNIAAVGRIEPVATTSPALKSDGAQLAAMAV